MSRRRRKPQYLSIGSVSSGTMRTEDLIPAFAWEAHSLQLSRDERRQLNGIIAAYQKNEDGYFESEEADYALDTLFDILNNHCPPYMYFGAHPGDGADYGCWLSEDWEVDFEGLKVSDTSEVPRGYSGEVLQVSDHGNPTLYRVVRGRRYEVWSVV